MTLETTAPGKPVRKLSRVERKRVTIGGDRMFSAEPLRPGHSLPLVIRPSLRGMELTRWAAGHREYIHQMLGAHGGILLRGFEVGGVENFRSFVQTVGGELEQYSYRSTPRTEVSGGVYTSTEYPADKFIPMHNEHSYTRSWPMKVSFYCELPAAEGGSTPIADSHRVYERIPEPIRKSFREKKVMYVRNYGEGIDLPWQEVFNTSSRSEVEAFCRQEGIELEWKTGDRLRTRQVCQAVIGHPASGKMLWFNQAHLFHVSSLGSEVAEELVEAFGINGVPRNTFFGDGTPIERSALHAIREAYAEEMIEFTWQREDVLFLDNMAVAHSRTPYRGERKIRAAMTEPMTAAAVEA